MNVMNRCTIALLLLMTWSCAHLRDSQNAGTGKGAGFLFQEENDSIAPGNRDKYYTQGLRWATTINPNWSNPTFQKRLNGLDKSLCKFLRCGQLNHKLIWSSGIAQTMYTPDDITKITPQPHDRPWAGFMYLDNTLRLTDAGSDPRVQHVIELQTGIIGKKSGARWAQSALHALIGSPHPIPGWRNQISSRPGIEAIYLYNRRYAWTYADFQPFAGAAAGNVMIYGNAGAYLRVGKSITPFFNTGPMQASLAGGGGTRAPLEFWVYGGYDGHFVPYNLFLSKGDIDPKKFVGDKMIGGSVRFYSYRLTYNYVRRSQEFSDPLGPQFGEHGFGSVVLSYELIIQ